MATAKSVEFFLRFIKKQHSEAKQSLESLFSALVNGSDDEKGYAVAKALGKMCDLQAAVAPEDRPQWVPQVIGVLNTAKSDKDYSTLVQRLLRWYPEATNHQWIFEEDDELGFDFEAVYRHYRAESRLPELFDGVLKILESMLVSGEISDRDALHALEKVISTIKRNKDSSFFSARGALEFLITFTKNFVFEQLKQIPGLGPMVAALEKTIGEMDEEMFQVSEKVKRQVAATLKADIPSISYNRHGQVQSCVLENCVSIRA